MQDCRTATRGSHSRKVGLQIDVICCFCRLAVDPVAIVMKFNHKAGSLSIPELELELEEEEEEE